MVMKSRNFSDSSSLDVNVAWCGGGISTVLTFPICLQASNGGHTSDYSSSLPSSPNVGHRELRAEAAAVAGLSTPGSLHRAAKRRTSLFAVLDMLTFLSSCLLLPAYLLWFLDPSVGPLFICLPCPSISVSLHPSSN